MLVRQRASIWPPVSCHSEIAGVTPDLQDVVVNVENKGHGDLIVRLRKNQKNGPLYAITLAIPENSVQQAILSIVRSGTTLLDVGEIKIA